jgi:RimK-like ATP-grasp domain
MILLCGLPTEPPFALVYEQVCRLGLPVVLFNQHLCATMAMHFTITSGEVTGQLRLASQGYHLEDFCGVYMRLIDDRLLPARKPTPADPAQRHHCRALHDTLSRWCELTPARVVNRISAMGSNSSKPYQAQLIRAHGFAVPETLITNDPELVRAFCAQHKHVVYKSMSGIRSIVQPLEEQDMARLDHIRWCPTQFQAFVEGTNVRVHTVDTEVFATAIHTQATDYRYAQRQGSHVAFHAITLPDALVERCLTLAQALNLPFAGLDLKITLDNQVYCFEVNPSPAFSYYEEHTQQPIAYAVARYLAGKL